MADTPKRKKLEKAVVETPVVSTQKFYCNRCGSAFSRRKGYFPVSHSPMYRGTGHLSWCNDCVDDMYDKYRASLGDDKAAMRRVCMKLDLYWNESIYGMVERSAGVHSRVRSYIGKTNIIRYIDKTFDDTLKEEAAEISKPQPIMSVSECQTDSDGSEAVSQEIIDFWGAGYTADFYAELERRYNDWTDGIEVVQPSERSLYRQICLLETIISRDGAQGKPIDKNVNALNTLLGSMNLKPAQKKGDGADAELDKMPLGVGIHNWELDRPLPKTPDELCDVNNNVRNITTWFLGHTSKMVGLRNSYCSMYEEAMERLRVDHPEYEEEDDDSLLNNIFGVPSTGGDE